MRRLFAAVSNYGLSREEKIQKLHNAVTHKFPQISDVEISYDGTVRVTGGRPGVFQSADDVGRRNAHTYRMSYTITDSSISDLDKMELVQDVEAYFRQTGKDLMESGSFFRGAATRESWNHIKKELSEPAL